MNNRLERNDTQEVITLPQDLRWTDELTWNAIAQAEPERTLSGGLIIQQGKKTAGRPITLQAENVWLPLRDIHILRDWTDVPELTMTYTHHDGRVFHVMFRLHETALTPEPVYFTTPENDSDHYTVAIKLMTV